MQLQASINIQAPQGVVWEVITDIKGSVEVLSGVDKIEILEAPAEGITGLKWRETRTLFGKQAQEVMTVIEVEAPRYYQVEAHNHGAHYLTEVWVEPRDEGGSQLRMVFNAKPMTFGARIMMFLLAPFFKKPTLKALQQDLEDIKKTAEGVHHQPS